MIKIWDKKESINGVSAEEYLEACPFFKNSDEIILICQDNGTITNVEDVETLRAVLGLDNTISALKVGEKYEAYLKENKETNNTEKDVNENTNEDINQLKIENEEMKKAIAELTSMIAYGGVK